MIIAMMTLLSAQMCLAAVPTIDQLTKAFGQTERFSGGGENWSFFKFSFESVLEAFNIDIL